MLSVLMGKIRRYRTRLLMRSALNGGLVYRVLRRGTGDRFNDRAAGWDQMVEAHEHKWFDPLDAALDQMPADWSPARVLDIGGGTGRAAYHLSQRFPEAQVAVLDLAPGMLAFGRNRRRLESLPPIEFVAGDSTAIPMRNEFIDLAFVLNAPLNAWEAARVLRPGGACVLAFTFGRHTPMYLDEHTARRALQQAGFRRIEAGTAGEGSWLIGVLGCERAD